VIVGTAALVGRLREDPLARALRVDKLTFAALEPVVAAYARGEPLALPVHALLAASVDDLASRVEAWRHALGPHAACTEVLRTEGAVGGGTLAEAPVESAALAVRVPSTEDLARALRAGSPPILGRIRDDMLLLDARTVFPAEDAALVAGLRAALTAIDQRSLEGSGRTL
jgi:L-seryl-tRNA(Ser) seleniumtransferase